MVGVAHSRALPTILRLRRHLPGEAHRPSAVDSGLVCGQQPRVMVRMEVQRSRQLQPPPCHLRRDHSQSLRMVLSLTLPVQAVIPSLARSSGSRHSRTALGPGHRLHLHRHPVVLRRAVRGSQQAERTAGRRTRNRLHLLDPAQQLTHMLLMRTMTGLSILKLRTRAPL